MTDYRSRRSAAAWLTTMAAATVLLAACDDDSDTTTPAAVPTTAMTGAPTLTVRAVPLESRVVRIAGDLPSARREAVVRRLTGAVRSWLDGGFIAPTYPQERFSDAFTRFTPTAARLARGQQRITTNAALGPDLVEVVPTRQEARFSIFAPHGRAAGATAYVRLILLGVRASGPEVEEAVAGQLYLTRDHGWQVFGFDVRRDVRAPGSAQASPVRARP